MAEDKNDGVEGLEKGRQQGEMKEKQEGVMREVWGKKGRLAGKDKWKKGGRREGRIEEDKVVDQVREEMKDDEQQKVREQRNIEYIENMKRKR